MGNFLFILETCHMLEKICENFRFFNVKAKIFPTKSLKKNFLLLNYRGLNKKKYFDFDCL